LFIFIQFINAYERCVTNTSKLWCRCNFDYWIAAELQWKCIKSSNPNQVIGDAQNGNSLLLGQTNLEITLIKRLPQCAESSYLSKSSNLNELNLTDDAFQSKLYTVRIEHGNYIEPCAIGYLDSDRPRFARRLLFDKSPYPPRSEWRKPEGGPDGGQFGDHKEFVCRRSSDLGKQGRAMNDDESQGFSNFPEEETILDKTTFRRPMPLSVEMCKQRSCECDDVLHDQMSKIHGLNMVKLLALDEKEGSEYASQL
ncbi:hypothetical protein EV356DRAFT_518537, partial [Viridothelium virens]